MKILVAHNFYKQPGGEDQCVAAEIALLRAYGHEVEQFFLHNDAIDTMKSVDVAVRTIWNQATYRTLRQVLQRFRPAIAHFHNTFPLISPAAYYAARAESVRVVQTLHNFRLTCVNALLFREGSVCQACLGSRVPWRGITRGCYRNSRAASATLAAMTSMHRVLGTWRNAVDAYIALSESSRRKLVLGGLASEKIVVKPNFIYPDPSAGSGQGNYGIFVGRLSEEKGIGTLLEAWRHLSDLDLKIVGDGPLSERVEKAVAGNRRIEWIRKLPNGTVCDLIGNASYLVLPSQCYENFPRVIAEAFAKGTPAIVSKLGAMAEIVEHDVNGAHFRPGDARDLAATVQRMLIDPTSLSRMRERARQTFDKEFTAAANYGRLIAIYERVLACGRRLERGDASVAYPYA